VINGASVPSIITAEIVNYSILEEGNALGIGWRDVVVDMLFIVVAEDLIRQSFL
jgi:hypothetical protein